MTEDIYRLAWSALLTRIEEKTSWGRNVLKDVMLDCLVNTLDKELPVPGVNAIVDLRGVVTGPAPGNREETCPLCGYASVGGAPHKYCAEQEQAKADHSAAVPNHFQPEQGGETDAL